MGHARSLFVLFLLSLAALLVYSNTFSVPFHFDDMRNIAENPTVHNLGNFFDLSGSRYVGLLTFALNYSVGGVNVFGYHLVNLLIHIANGFLVYWLVLLLLSADRGSKIEDRGSWIALATALLFIVHPIQTQAVTYIVQRFASLVTLFYLLAVVCYLKWRLSQTIGPGGPIRLIYFFASLLSTLLAMKTKENSFTLPFMILLSEWVFFGSITRKRWLTLIPFLLTLPVVPLSLGATPGEAQFAQETMALSRTDYLFTQFRVIVTYLRLLILPINQNADYDYPAYHSLFEPAVFASFLFLASLVGFALFLLFRSRAKLATLVSERRIYSARANGGYGGASGKAPDLIAFGILWFFLALAVESSIFPIQDVMFEHRVYLPGVGFFMAVSAGLFGRNRLKTEAKPALWTIVITVLVVISLGGAAFRRNFVWADGITLWQDVIRKAPHNAKGHHNLGSEFGKRVRLEEAIREYKTALELEPNYPEARKNLGNAYALQGRIEEAIASFHEALRLKPDYEEAKKNLEYVVKNQERLMKR